MGIREDESDVLAILGSDKADGEMIKRRKIDTVFEMNG